MLGSVILGIGTLLGTVAGGIVGGIKGRRFTNKIKRENLKEAVRKYKEAYQDAQPKIISLQKYAQQQCKQYEDSVQVAKCTLSQSTAELKENLEKEQDNLIRQRRELYRVNPQCAHELLKSALNDLEAQKKCLSTTPKWILRVVGTNLRNARQERIDALERLFHSVESKATAIIKAQGEQDLVGDKAIKFLQLLLSIDAETGEILQMIHEFEVRRKELETNWQQFCLETRQRLSDQRFECMKNLGEIIRSLKEEMNQKVGDIRRRLEPLAKSVEIEMARLGK